MKKTVKRLTILILACVILVFLGRRWPEYLRRFMQWQPPNLLIAAAVFALIYAVKGALMFFPITVLQIAAGHFFPPAAALGVNTAGLAVVMAVPYWIGRTGGMAKVEKFTQRYPKIGEVIGFQRENEFAACFLLRACSIPPADVLTACFGATGTGFWANMAGGLLGCFPSMALTTVLGANIRDPGSPAFWLSLGLNVLWVIVSALGYWLFRRARAKRNKP